MDFKSAFVIEAGAHHPIGTGSFWTIVEAKLMNIHRLSIKEERAIIRLAPVQHGFQLLKGG